MCFRVMSSSRSQCSCARIYKSDIFRCNNLVCLSQRAQDLKRRTLSRAFDNNNKFENTRQIKNNKIEINRLLHLLATILLLEEFDKCPVEVLVSLQSLSIGSTPRRCTRSISYFLNTKPITRDETSWVSLMVHSKKEAKDKFKRKETL